MVMTKSRLPKTLTGGGGDFCRAAAAPGSPGGPKLGEPRPGDDDDAVPAGAGAPAPGEPTPADGADGVVDGGLRMKLAGPPPPGPCPPAGPGTMLGAPTAEAAIPGIPGSTGALVAVWPGTPTGPGNVRFGSPGVAAATSGGGT